MKLSEATAVIRPRRGWEAIDLGIRMVQRDFSPLARRWIISTLPWYALTLYLGTLLGDISYGILMFWWLKPAFDRVLLDYLSQRLFSQHVEDPGPLDLWFRLPFSASAWRQLTYLRFSLVRTFSLPVYQLEGGGKNRGERIRTLIARDYGASAWLTMVFYFLSTLILVVVISQLAKWLHPSPIILEDADLWDTMFNTEELFTGTLYWLHLLLFYVITGVFELFFAGAGFAMYLNRRTHLEAWDIELSFRRLAQRLSQGTTSLILASCVVALTFVVEPVSAQSTDPELPASQHSTDSSIALPDSSELPGPATPLSLPAAEEARSVVSGIYNADEFGEHINERAWRAKATDDEEELAEADTDLFEQLGPFVALLARIIKYLVVAVVVILVALWIVRERKRLLNLRKRSNQAARQAPAQAVDEGTEFIPDADVPNVVSKLWAEGKLRESMSYLYRSALAYLTSRHQLVIGDHATEEDCLRLVRENASAQVSTYFSDITRQWRLLAYGNRQPADATVEELCSRWSQLAPPSNASTGNLPRA